VTAAREYGLDRAGRMAAAIAYRTVFALAPLLIIAVSVAGAVLGSSVRVRERVLDAIASVAGPQVSDLVGEVLRSALREADAAAVIGIALLFWIGSSLFLELQLDLNDIFGVPTERINGLFAVATKRAIGFLWALGLGIALMAILVLNAVWRFLGDLLPPRLETVHVVVSYLSPLISLVLLPLIFGLVFRTMTTASVPWKAVWRGGLFTAAVFVATAYGVGLYFGRFDTPSALGFAGSLVVVIFLAYLLSSVFLFGAEVTKVYAERLGQREKPPWAQTLSTDRQVLVAEPQAGIPRVAFLAFLAGLLVGWRRNRR
jgi:membrane protein